MRTLEPLSVPAVRTEELLMAARLRPSLNSKFDVHIDAAVARHGVSRELVRAIIKIGRPQPIAELLNLPSG